MHNFGYAPETVAGESSIWHQSTSLRFACGDEPVFSTMSLLCHVSQGSVASCDSLQESSQVLLKAFPASE